MSFDLVYKEIGDLGRYQLYVLALGWLNAMYGAFIFINSIFLLHVPDHRCALPGYENDTYEIQNEAHQMMVNSSIPLTQEGEYDKCQLYSSISNTFRDDVINSTTTTCNSWVYDASRYPSTLGSKLNLVCSRAILKSTAQMIFFGGLLVGSFISGIISDRIGRKPTMYVSTIFLLALAISVAWAPSIEVYMIQSACLGFFFMGMFMPIYVTGMEFVGPSKRLIAGQMGSFFWVFGNLVMTGFAYMERDWSKFQIICAAPGVFMVFYWILYPESPRWLYIQGRRKEMKKLILKAASVNRVKVSEDFIDNLPVPTKAESKVPFYKLFSHRVLAIRTIVLYINWMAVCMAYYGLALNSDGLGSGGGIHLYFFLQCLMDIPASLIVILLADRTGRKPLLVGSMLIGGLACVATMFIAMFGGENTAVATLVLALIGKVGASSGFHLAYQYSAEIFPTVVRNAGIGSSSCMARVGGIIAPFVADLDRLVGGKFGKALPLLIFGSLSVIAGLLALILPETLNKELPETIQDGITFGRTIKRPDPGDKSAVTLLSNVNNGPQINTFETIVKKENKCATK